MVTTTAVLAKPILTVTKKGKMVDFGMGQLWDLGVPLDWIRVTEISEPEDPEAEKEVSQYPSILMVPESAAILLA